MAAQNRKKESTWRRHVEAQADSGQSVRSYCQGHGLREHGFYWWRRELARRHGVKSSAPVVPPAFVPVTVAGDVPVRAPGRRIEIVLRGGWRVRVTGPVDRQMLADVLAVLSAQPGGVAC